MSTTTDPSGNSYGYPASILKDLPEPYLPASPPEPEPTRPPAKTPTIHSQPGFSSDPYAESKCDRDEEKPSSSSNENKPSCPGLCCYMCATCCMEVVIGLLTGR